MTFINYASREINCKIVYYGPGLCGKTTNLQYIYERTNPEAKGKMISLATETERTLFFDFAGVPGAETDWPPEEVIRSTRLLYVDHYGTAGMIRAVEA